MKILMMDSFPSERQFIKKFGKKTDRNKGINKDPIVQLEEIW